MIWLDGRLQAPAAARIDPADRGFLLGDGVFETVRAVARQPWHLPRHLARLRRGAGVLGIGLTWTDADVAQAASDVLAACPHADAVLRMTLTRGPGGRGVLPAHAGPPTLLIAAAALPPPPGPAHVVVARVTRRNEHSPLSRIKSLNYGDSILARREAAGWGADEAILLNSAGFVAEACAGNMFFVLDEGLVTPRVEDGALPGIARGLIVEAGLAAEQRVSARDVEAARGAYVTNSLGVRRIESIDGRVLRGVGPDPGHVHLCAAVAG